MNLAWQRLLFTIMREAEGHATGAGNGSDTRTSSRADDDADDDDDEPDDAPDQDAKAWQRYAKRLRKENAKRRDQVRTLSSEVTTLKSAQEKAKAETQKAVDEALKKAREEWDADQKKLGEQHSARLVNAELRSLATAAGMIDLDGLKLADASGISVNDEGVVVGADKVIEALQKSKPHLFGKTTTSSTETPPQQSDGKKKSAKDMSAEEYTAAKSALTGSKLPSRRF